MCIAGLACASRHADYANELSPTDAPPLDDSARAPSAVPAWFANPPQEPGVAYIAVGDGKNAATADRDARYQLLDQVTDQVIEVATILADIVWRYQDIFDHGDVEMFLGLREALIVEALHALAGIRFEALPIADRARRDGTSYARIRLVAGEVVAAIYPALFDAAQKIDDLHFGEDSVREWLAGVHGRACKGD